MKTKVIAFDVYGTFLATDDPDNVIGVRNGFIDFANRCRDIGLKIVTSSDNYIPTLKCDLIDSGVPLSLFDGFFQMKKKLPKNYGPIIKFFGIENDELFVFGDKMNIDITSAIVLGCRFRLLPEFVGANDKFDWNSVDIKIFE